MTTAGNMQSIGPLVSCVSGSGSLDSDPRASDSIMERIDTQTHRHAQRGCVCMCLCPKHRGRREVDLVYFGGFQDWTK